MITQGEHAGQAGVDRWRLRLRQVVPWLLGFILIAMLNSGGYRYGISDQAFYAPAVLARLEPGLFPRDGVLIRSQAKLTLVDETMAALVRMTRLQVPALFALLHVLTLGLLAYAAIDVSRSLYRTRWASIALLAALSMRHAIARSGTNTLEAYFHPRQLAFALGLLAVAAFLRGRHWTLAASLVGAAMVHPTTALWFGVWLGVAVAVHEPRLRVPAAVAAGVAVLTAMWALVSGPLAGRFGVMDAEWLATLSNKNYLFPLDWPVSAWLLNVGYVPVIGWIFRIRRTAGLTTPHEAALVAGCLSLAAVFALALPLNAARIQLAVQMQPARIFWMLDFVAIAYTVWAVVEGSGERERSARIVALIVVLLALARGAYVASVVWPVRGVVTLDIPDNDWGRAMQWARTTRIGSHWLADPLHAIQYGTSVRVAGHRDVLVEAVKDEAIGMYDRDVAIRTRDRLAAVGDFGTLTSARARELAAAYDLDYLITERPLDLPLAFSSGPIRVYELK